MRSIGLLAQKYGPIFQLNILGNTQVFLNSYELLDEISDEKKFYKNVGGPLTEVRNLGGDGLFTAFHDEPNWGIARKSTRVPPATNDP